MGSCARHFNRHGPISSTAEATSPLRPWSYGGRAHVRNDALRVINARPENRGCARGNAVVNEQRVIQIDASAHAARSAILFLRDLHVLHSSSVLKMPSCHAVEGHARNAHVLSLRSRAFANRLLA